jgi:hypothetical protein
MIEPIEQRSDKETINWPGLRGKTITLDVNQVIDVRDFIGTPGYALLLLAANTNLSASVIDCYLHQRGGVNRSMTWIRKRRWLFQQPGTNNAKGPTPNADRNDARAIKIMSENPELSLRNLVVLLKERGIKRSREWVRQRRCDGEVTTVTHK